MWGHQRRMVRVAWMEKLMSTTNDTSRELTSSELDAVSGGAFPLYWFLASQANWAWHKTDGTSAGNVAAGWDTGGH
jgi:hypothetical protein